MVKVQIEPERIIRNFLRQNLTDPNSSRSGNWIMTDFPRIADLGNKSFPRISITKLSESSSALGIFDNDQWETINLEIDVWAKKGLFYNLTTTDEALGTMSSSINSDRISYEYIPSTVTNVKHAGTSFGTVTLVTNDAAFTSPASLTAGTVQVSKTTGNFNFSASDLTSYNTQAITSTSIFKGGEKKICMYLARELIKAIRTLWRTDTTFRGLYYPNKINHTPIPIDEEIGIYRQMVEYRVNAFNCGEGI